MSHPDSPKLRTIDSAFVAELEALGFFRFLSTAEAEAAKREILARGYPLAAEVGRQFMADAEDLAEQGVRNFVGYVAPILRREGVNIEVEYRPRKVGARPPGSPPDPNPYPGPTERMRLSLEPGADPVAFEEDFGAEQYRLTVGAREVVVWSDAGGDSWQAATARTVGLLNELLSKHGSPERAWSLYGGNDGFIVFATVEQAALVNSALVERERLSAAES